MKIKRTVRHRLLLLEVVCGIGLVALLLSGVYASVHANEQLLQQAIAERQALDVLDNALERLAAEAPVSLARCRAVLAEELAPSPLARRRGVASVCERDADGSLRCVLRDRKHRLAEIRIGRREP